ncbi:RING FINGER PROTEIN 41 151 [Salix viminalis]|uniref:RING FINGER PROTEIN 41 151 n=1 Tax=Salix viminalis TaxID=40686 RepID=A0A9Q0TLQ6_SALVM|nr:RING FINGER PROTEIN 41 151 [Salix viminalis]
MTSVCPFVKPSRPDDGSSRKPGECPDKHVSEHEGGGEQKKESVGESATVSPKCPFGYDSQTFKLGPHSCMICQALLFDCSKCVPCSHVYCKVCISRFKDCPLCGADIEKIEADTDLQSVVDRFIDGHARIKRGAFLVQQAMRAFRAQNVESARSRLSLCAEDIRGLEQCWECLGTAVEQWGMLGSSVTYFQESVEFLSKLPAADLEIMHTLSVSLNKIGDLKYYDEDLEAARSYYIRSLNVRRDAIKHHPNVSSQTLDVAVSLAKVADVDRTMGNEDAALDRFREAIKLLGSLTLKPEEAGLEQRRLSVLEFLNNQLAEKQSG